MNKEEYLIDRFNRDIVYHILKEIDPKTDDLLVDKIWAMCNNNPWKSGVLYKKLKLAGKL